MFTISALCRIRPEDLELMGCVLVNSDLVFFGRQSERVAAKPKLRDAMKDLLMPEYHLMIVKGE